MNEDTTQPNTTAKDSSVLQTKQKIPQAKAGPAPTITLAAVEAPELATNNGTALASEEFAPATWSRVLASPRGVMLLVPLLVLLLGAALTLIGQTALTAASHKMASERFEEQTNATGLRMENALGLAEPLLNELERIARAVDQQPVEKREVFTPLGLELRDLLVGRRAITQAYIAFPDGTFLSADPQGGEGVAFQITRKGFTQNYRVQGQAMQETERRESNYNPRVRDWYKLASERKERTWSAPYSFYFNQHPGVTRSLPIYRDTERTQLLAVVGVDFDVEALTAFMASGEFASDSVHSVVFTLQGVILAYPRGADKISRLPKSEKVPTHDALGDPALSQLIAKVQGLPGGNHGPSLLDFRVDEEPHVASIRRVGAGGPDWYVATFSTQSDLLHELYNYRRRSLWVGSLSLIVAMGLAWLLARHLLYVRRVASEAQEAARQARVQIRDLGSYRLISRIGEGGMGEVWRARHRLLARQAAIKLIKKDRNEPRQEEHRERFRREAQAIAGLRSRNTVALFDYGLTSDGTLFYVMELLDGIDLSTLVSRHGPQPQERVRQILLQACRSLSEAHQAGLVHRDIKPANLFLCREAEEVDVVKVLDFGLVFQVGLDDVVHADPNMETKSLNGETPVPASTTEVGRITDPNHQLGTPAFMSPEQALGNETDARSDLYSLACVAWWLLCGKPVFNASTQLALMLKHIEEKIPHLGETASSPISLQFQEILERCLKKSPADRFQSTADLAQALQALGRLSPDWTDTDAQEWWLSHIADRPELKPNLSLPPLRDAVMLPPAG